MDNLAPLKPAGKRSVSIRRIHGWWMDRFLRMFSPRHPASKSYRYLARQIQAEFPDRKRGVSLAVTCPGSLELCTETLLMFSCFLQDELGCSVLIIDASLHDEGVGARLGQTGATGFLNLLYGESRPVAELTQSTARSGVSLLPAGTAPSGGFSPLQPQRAADILAEACAQYDYVLVQQGSLLADTRHLLIPPAADLTVLLVEEGVTLVEELDACQKVLRDHQVDNVRLLLSTPKR